MKRVLALMLVAVMVFSFAGVAIAAEPTSKVLDSTNIVNVTGKLESGGDYVNILLMDESKNVKYINEFPVESDGTYRAKFKYPADIAKLSLQVKQGLSDVTDSVVEAISEKEAITYELNVVNVETTSVKAEIENYFNVEGKTYQVMIAYYGENNKLLDVYVRDEKTVANDKTEDASSYEIPAGTEKIKVFMWDSVKTMVPLAKEVTGKKNDKEIKILTIGNSFADDSIQYLDDIARKEGITITIHAANLGGSRFATHWNAISNELPEYKYNGESVTLDYFLDNNTYDYITVQQLSNYSGMYDTYEGSVVWDDNGKVKEDGADDILKYLREKQPTAEIVLHATWAYEKESNHAAFPDYDYDQQKMHDAIYDAVPRYAEYAAKLKTDTGLSISLDGKPLRYIPTGLAFMNARQYYEFDTENDMTKRTYVSGSSMFLDETKYVGLHRDSYHASFTWGRYLAALTWYGALTGNSTLDVEFTPSSNGTMTNAQRQVLNRAANDALNSVGFWR